MKLIDKQKLENEIIEKCAELGRYDDYDYAPPALVDEMEGEHFETFWDWIQTLLKASARNAIGAWVESQEKENESLQKELTRIKEQIKPLYDSNDNGTHLIACRILRDPDRYPPKVDVGNRFS